MSGIVDAIGLVSSILGIASFLQDNFPGQNDAGTTVQIKLGLGDGGSGLGGTITSVYGFDAQNNYLGNSGSGYADAGGIMTLTVNQDVPGRQGAFISVSNSDDATCISWISVTQYDGSQGGAWTGDIGKACTQDWFPSNQRAGTFKNGTSWYPACGWLDSDHTNDIIYGAMKFNVYAYGTDVQTTLDNQQGCSASIFSVDAGPISGEPAGPVFGNDKRSLHGEARALSSFTQRRSPRSRLPWMETRLIVSNITSHSAEEVCTSDTSYGPDFIGADGKYCDMGSKTLHSLCSTEKVDGCVELSIPEKSVTKRSTVARRDVQTLYKSFLVVSEWSE